MVAQEKDSLSSVWERLISRFQSGWIRSGGGGGMLRIALLFAGPGRICMGITGTTTLGIGSNRREKTTSRRSQIPIADAFLRTKRPARTPSPAKFLERIPRPRGSARQFKLAP